MAIGVVVPFVALYLSECYYCAKYEIRYFEMDVVALQASLAAVSLLCLSHNLRKYGLKRFLFVGRRDEQIAAFHEHYVRQISVSEFEFCLRYLRVDDLWLGLCLFVIVIVISSLRSLLQSF